MMQKTITVLQGFLAMEKFLENWYELTKFDDIQFLLGGMDLDPAFWEDWTMCAYEVLKDSKEEKGLTDLEAFQAMVKFLEKYYQLTQSDDIGLLLGGMDTSFWSNKKPFDPALWDDWVEAVQKVLKESKNEK